MRLCEVSNCKNKHYAKGLCKLHWQRKYRNQPLNMNTIYQERKYIVKGDVAYIPLWNGNYTKIDKSDLEIVRKHKWSLDLGYAKTNIDNKTIRLHTLILNIKDYQGKEIDHINRDKLDNRRTNLRLVNRVINSRNKGLYSHNTSGYTGVLLVQGKWQAQIKVMGKQIILGRYESKDDAIEARIKGENKYWLPEI